MLNSTFDFVKQMGICYDYFMKKDETIQNYLEAIYIISLKKEKVHAIDVVNYMNFSRPTVSISLKKLEKEEYITINKKEICLTEKGKKVASLMYERHEYIAKVLMSLGVSEKQAYDDSCLVEHDLSEESFEAIKKATINKIK